MSRDFETAAALGRAGRTFADVDTMAREGRISARAADWYVFLWTWSAARFSGTAGRKQDRFHARRGAEALERRFQRVRSLCAR
jgi:hypothetical protein